MGRFTRHAAVFAVVGLMASSLAAQSPRRLTIDVIYDPDTRADFSGAPATQASWLDATTYVSTRRAARGVDWVKVDAGTGRTSPLFDASRMEEALAGMAGISREVAVGAAHSPALSFTAGYTAALTTIAGDLYFYDITGTRAARLTSVAGDEEEPMLSPDGRSVAFVRNHNLFVVDTATSRERALTGDGSADILNGLLDWLYQEEIYGRGRFRGYWWSPDSAKLAFLRLDEKPVPDYTVVDHIPYRPTLEVTDYPKAGDPNPLVKVGIVPIDGNNVTWADMSAYTADDMLVTNVDWSPDSAKVMVNVQDREQTRLDLNTVDARSGRSTRLIRETSKAWVNENGTPTWLKDGTFLWFSERTGYKHLYHYKPDGTLIRQVTTGRWEVRTLYGIDEARNILYFSAVERTPIGVDIYKVSLDGTGFSRLSQREGTHRAEFNPTFTQYVDVWSDAATPTQIRLHRVDGSELRVIDTNAVPALGQYRLSPPQFLQVPTRDGGAMDAMMIKPPDFDPARRYPVYQFTYAGPGAAQVLNRWSGSTQMFYQLLAQEGVIVWVLDNRSASGRGVESQWPVYGRLGELELRDLEDGVTWLKTQPYVDASRLVLSGWSYGGFMTAYALTHSTSWAAGIVGAPVTDWRDYDSIYTERLMKTPQHNPDGYRQTAPRFAAANLHGRMLLIHGTMDDNVHMQNSVQFAYELQKLNKPFQMMTYAKSRHGFSDPRLTRHLQQMMLDFVMDVVRAPRAAQTSSAGAPAAGR